MCIRILDRNNSRECGVQCQPDEICSAALGCCISTFTQCDPNAPNRCRRSADGSFCKGTGPASRCCKPTGIACTSDAQCYSADCDATGHCAA